MSQQQCSVSSRYSNLFYYPFKYRQVIKEFIDDKIFTFLDKFIPTYMRINLFFSSKFLKIMQEKFAIVTIDTCRNFSRERQADASKKKSPVLQYFE